MDLSPRAKLGIVYCLSILVPAMLTGISLLLHKSIEGWIWVPAGIFTFIILTLDSVRGSPSLARRLWSSNVVTKIRVGSKMRGFVLVTLIYAGGILALMLLGKNKPVLSWLIGIGSAALYATYQIRAMNQEMRRVEANFRRIPIAPASRPPPDVSGSTPLSVPAPEAARIRHLVVHIEGQPDIELPAVELSQPTLEVLPEPEPDNRFTRILKDDYPL